MVNSTIFGKINKISFLLSAFPLIFCVRFLLKSYLCDEQQTNTESTHMNFSGIIRSIITVSDFAGCPFTLSFALFMKNSQFFNQKSYADNLEMCGICLNTHTHTHTHTFSSRVNLQKTFNLQLVSESFLSKLFRFPAQRPLVEYHTASVCCLPTERYPSVCRRYTVIIACPCAAGAFYIPEFNPI